MTLAARADDAALAALGGPRLVAIVREQGCRFEENDDLAAFEAVSLAAASPETPDACALALAILLADALQEGLAQGTLDGYADASLDAIRTAPRPLRAALVRGFETARTLGGLGLLPPELPFEPEERITTGRDVILGALCDLARSMDSPTRDFVSRADYGCDDEEHRNALTEVLLRDDCRFTKDEYLYPSEVVELISHVPTQPGFAECTALLLVNAIPTDDEMGWLDYRWDNNAEAYNGLPPRAAAPILAGFRHHYETSGDFLWYHTRQYDPVLLPERMIPLVDFPPAST